MHRIYFENRSITVCGPEDPVLGDPNTVKYIPSPDDDMRAAAAMLETGEYPGNICIPAADEEGTYRRLCSVFREVSAAGGLVRNLRGDFLLIRRNSMWDLPKGHREPGEDIRITAVREVEEETGIRNLRLGDLICVTDHCYLHAGVWHLKHTWWYGMLYDGPTDLFPQEEEDIAKAAWVARSGLPPYLKDTFPSIAEVFRKAGV